jgi:DNA-binding MarR family transcriptional regulator
MDPPEDVHLLHQPVRLRLMALLFQRGDVGFTAACQALGTTPGNLDAHARRLEAHGMLAVRKELLRSGFEVRYRITPVGRARFKEYLVWLQAFVQSVADVDGKA